jgi:hypothetical protein
MTGKLRKPLPLSEEDDDALMKRVEVIVRREELPSLTPHPEPPQFRERRQLRPIKLMVPDYLFRELTMNAARSGVTKKYLILKVLQDAGYQVDASDLEEDGRRLR